MLAPRLLDYAQHSWDAVRFPWQIDFDEGINLNASWLLSQGVNIYRPNPPDHFISSMYPPLYFALNAVAIKLWGLNLASGRVIALLGAMAAGAMLWTWVYAETRRHAAGLLAALTWFSLGPVYAWSTFYKQDMLALALGLAGGALAAGAASEGWKVEKFKGLKVDNSPTFKPSILQTFKLYLAIVPLALSFWVKQSSLAPMAAVGLFLLLRDRRLAVRWGLAAAASILVPFAALDVVLRGGLHAHVLAFDHYGRSAARLAKNMDALWTQHAPLVLCGAGFAVLGIWSATRQRRSPPLSTLYLLVATPAALLGNSLPTANYNHLLDILAPLCLALGVALGTAWRKIELGGMRLDRALLAGGVLALAFAQAGIVYNKPGWTWYTPLGIPLEERAERMEKISQAVKQAPGEVLSEDNWLLLKNGKRVLYDDPAAMAALANAGEWDQSVLLQDINRRKFSLVLLQYDLTNETYNPRWTNQALDALKANYDVLFRDVVFSHAPRAPGAKPQTLAGCSAPGGPLLEGYTFRSTTANRGDALAMNIYWRGSGGEGQAGVKFFVRLVDGSGAPRWGADLLPGETAGKPWPAGWTPGEPVRDDLSLPVPADLPYGDYRLLMGTYTVDTAGGIRALRGDCTGNVAMDPDGAIVMSSMQVVERWGR
jgi:hypothetical protein